MEKDDEKDNNDIFSECDNVEKHKTPSLKDGDTISTENRNFKNVSDIESLEEVLNKQNIAAQLANLNTKPLYAATSLAAQLAKLDTKPLYAATSLAAQLANLNTKAWDKNKNTHKPDFYAKNKVYEPLSLVAFRNIGIAVTEIRLGESYEAYGAEKIREVFGDWRDFDFNQHSESSHEAKSDIIKATGFDQEISETSINVLGDYMDVLGFKYKIDSTTKSDFSEASKLILPSDLTHRDIASKKLADFEIKLRKFIEAIMQREVGQNWFRTHLPNGMYEKWVEKQQKYQKRYGHSKSIIEFADFTDYSLLIRNGKAFPFFQKYFVSKESILESFNRIEPARLELAHSREMLTPLEYVLFCAEIARIEKAMSS